jgi:hypothetical protein
MKEEKIKAKKKNQNEKLISGNVKMRLTVIQGCQVQLDRKIHDIVGGV